jgi:hypothetical protein
VKREAIETVSFVKHEEELIVDGIVRQSRMALLGRLLGIIPVYAPVVFEDTDSDYRTTQWDRKGGLR